MSFPRLTSNGEAGRARRAPHGPKLYLFICLAFLLLGAPFWAEAADGDPPLLTAEDVVIPLRDGYVGEKYGVGLAYENEAFMASGDLPPGLRLTPKPAGIVGTPTQAGTWQFKYSFSRYSTGNIETFTMSITVKYPVPKVVTPTLRDGTVGTAYKVGLFVTGSPTSITADGLPPGLSLSGSTIAGTPTQAGTYTVSVTAANEGETSEVKIISLKINPKDAGSVAVAVSDAPTYTGAALTPAPTVMDGSTALVVNTDYTLSYFNNVNAGTASVLVKFIGNYGGDNISADFTIKRKNLSTTARIDDIPPQTYTGSAITPSLSVVDGTAADGPKTLVSGTDYIVGYDHNTEAGTAKATVTFAGNYDGSATKTFTINPIPDDGLIIAAISDQTYTGAAIVPDLAVSDAAGRQFAPSEYDASFSGNVNAGTAAVSVTLKGGDYSGTAMGSFVILPKDISTATIETIPDQTYTGSPLIPALSVKDGTAAGGPKTLVQGTDYTTAYSNNTAPGLATVTLTGINNYRGANSGTFSITKVLNTDTRLTSVADVLLTVAGGTADSPGRASVSVPSSKPSITTSDIVCAFDASFHIYSDPGFSQNRDTAVTLPSGGSAHVYVKVTAEDGVTTSYYDVTVSRPGSDAGLTSVAGIGVSTAGSGASISSPQTAAVIVDRGKSSLAATEVICSAGASVTVYTDKNFAAPVQSIALNPGDYTHVYVKATAQDRSLTLYYDVIVNRPNNDAGLVSMAGHNLTPGGGTGIYGTPKTAAITVASGQGTITLADVVGAPDAVVHIYSDSAFSQNQDQPVALTPGGATHAYVKVTSEDGSSTLYYDVTVNRDRILSSSADLTSVAGTPVTPGNQAGTVNDPKIVSLTTREEKSSLTLVDIGSSSGASVHIYSDGGFSQNQDSPVSLTPGVDSHVYVKITSEDGSTSRYYNVVVKRPRHLSSDASLTSIAGQPVPAGAGAGTPDSPIAVTIGTGSGQSSIGLPDIAGAPSASVHIYSDSGFSQNEDLPVNVTEGGTAHIYIRVTAEDGTTKYYDVTDNRAKEPSPSAELTAVAGVSVTPGTEAGTSDAPLTASAVVPTGQASIALSDLLFSSGATAHIYSDVSFLHDQDAPLPLPANGSSVHLFVTVIAEDGTTALHYDVTVARIKVASSDANLISVAGNGPFGTTVGGDSPSNPVVIAVDTASGKSSITTSDVVAATGATVHIYPSNDYTNNEDGAVNVPDGGTAHLYVKVTAEDNVTSKYYDVMVNRAKTLSADAGLTTIAGQPVTDSGGAGTVGAPDAETVTVPSGQRTLGPSDVGSASGSVAHIYSDGSFSQNQDAPVTLNPGENHVHIEVTAEDGSTKYYDVQVNRENPPAPEPVPVPAPVPEPTPLPEPEPSDPTLSSTNITYGGVSIDGGLHWQNLERQTDGTWLVVVPWDTDLTRLALTFRLPNPETRIVPTNGTPRNFSDGKAVAYTVISADGSNTATYRVRAVRRPFEVLEDVLVEPTGAQWKLTAEWTGDGLFFVIQAPIAASETSVTLSHQPLRTYVALDNWYYSMVTLGLLDFDRNALSPYRSAGGNEKPYAMQIAGIAEDLEALEGLVVDGVEWSFADEPGEAHAQALYVTFADIGDKTFLTTDEDGTDRRHRGGGCATSGFGLLLLTLLLLPMAARKKK
ncbi:MAG: cadherin-like beta sandwich domain-containing protein [Synergistaceae bacterium]|nr:cadherin-like beta sandwich domain-containing protein [Synergistaceae bacterium]